MELGLALEEDHVEPTANGTGLGKKSPALHLSREGGSTEQQGLLAEAPNNNSVIILKMTPDGKRGEGGDIFVELPEKYRPEGGGGDSCCKKEEAKKTRRSGWRSYLGIALALSASSCFALGLMLVKMLTQYHPYVVSFWRVQGMTPAVILAFYYSVVKKEPIFSILCPPNKKGNGKNVALLLVRCITSAISITLQVYSVQYISVADSSTISYSTPVFVTLASHVFLGEKSGIVPVLCGIITLFGVVTITRPPMLTGKEAFDMNTLIGSAMALGCMFGAVASFLSLRSLRRLHFSVILLFVGIWGSLQTAAMAVSVGRFDIPEGWTDWGLVAGLVLLSFLGQITITLAFKFENAGTVALCRTFDIVFAFLWQYIFLGLVPDLISLLGGGIVLTGMIVAGFRKFLEELPVEDKRRKALWILLK